MNKVVLTLLLSAVAVIGVGCTRVGPGHVGILVDMAGSNRGVLDKPVRTGWVFYNPFSESVYEYPTYIQTAKWTASPAEGKPNDESVTFTNKDSMSINADISISYDLTADKVPYFYVKFLAHDQDDIESKFTHGFLRNVARDCINEHAGKYAVEDIMGNNAPFIADARKCIQDQVKDYGVQIEQFGFIGSPRPPQNVIEAINMKAQSQQIAQRKQNELQQVQADAAKQVAQAEADARSQVARANGDAQANHIRSSSLTDMLLKQKQLENTHDAIWRWDGKMPATMAGGAGSGFLMNIPEQK